ncbi:MAG: chemotaxis protein CheW [Magnetococcales bacterium]|nr:chemotaxis protein CheW [Magnetococcales bacterium]
MSDQSMSTTQFLTFTLAEETFAVSINQIREVLEFTSLTEIPSTPEFMVGVINLRGHVVPVVDMRIKFGMEQAERTVNTCIIIIEVKINEDDSVLLGAMADSVNEVMELRKDAIEPAPKIGTGIDTDYILGMGKQGNNFVILLDTQKVFSMEEMGVLKSAERAADQAA